MLEVLIGSAVGTVGVYFWSWRRARAARAQERSSTSEFERTLRRARDNFAVAKYSVPLDTHAELVALLAATNLDCEALLGVSKGTLRTVFLTTFSICIPVAVLPVWLYRAAIPAIPLWEKVVLSFAYGAVWLGLIQPTLDVLVLWVLRKRSAKTASI